MDLVEVLTKAKKIIAKHQNWCKGAYSTGSRCCAVGAINKAATGSPFRFAFKDGGKLTELINSVQDPDCGSLSEFNDDKKTKHKDVIKLFNKAIKHAKAFLK